MTALAGLIETASKHFNKDYPIILNILNDNVFHLVTFLDTATLICITLAVAYNSYVKNKSHNH